MEGNFLSSTLGTTARENLGFFFFDSGGATKKTKYVSSLLSILESNFFNRQSTLARKEGEVFSRCCLSFGRLAVVRR